MMRSYLKFCIVMSAAALIGMSATSAWAASTELVDNGDMEAESRFSPWGTPDDGDPNWPGSTPTGRPDAWHHSGDSVPAVWSDPNSLFGGPHATTSGIHALWLQDDPNAGGLTGESEFRSFAGTTSAGGDFDGIHAGNIPGVANAGRSLVVSWKWKWDITSDPNHVFSGTVRTSTLVSTGLDLLPDDPNGIDTFTQYVFSTGTGTSGGYLLFSEIIPIAAGVAQFDIIFNTSDRTAPDFDGRLNATGEMFVDDVSVFLIPEPASLLLLSVAGLMALRRRRRE